tara:strand:+ start:11405 stop:12250 length:846 start_codon:yes stop_codon:yes gene_type:complete
MKAKTIEKEIEKKITDWASSIEDKSLAEDLPSHVIVTGGCIASMLLKETVNDFDIYLSTPEIAFRLAAYYVEKSGVNARLQVQDSNDIEWFEKDDICISEIERVQVFIKSSGVASVEPDKDKKYQAIFFSSNAITLTDKVQVILRFTGNAKEIHTNYDFIHATNYWSLEEGLVTNTRALECILARELIYTGSKYPLSSIFRTRKFIQRGWCCHVANYLKMAIQLNDLDLMDIDVLRDQLTGVDLAYLSGIADALESADSLTSAYVIKVIERMLGEKDTDSQ